MLLTLYSFDTFVFVVILLIIIFFNSEKIIRFVMFRFAFPKHWRDYLLENVAFYRQLNPEKQQKFEKRIQAFLLDYQIQGVETTLTEYDKLLVAASGVIPVFGFDTWYYRDLEYIYIFPDAFTITNPMFPDEVEMNGLVGYGGMANKMYLSLKALRKSFMSDNTGQNTGMHEFLHLMDMEDGEADGVPETVLKRSYVKPWIELIQTEIQRVCDDDSILGDYACENAAEFFAESGVAFFEKPKEMEEKHPELYRMLSEIFLQRP